MVGVTEDDAKMLNNSKSCLEIWNSKIKTLPFAPKLKMRMEKMKKRQMGDQEKGTEKGALQKRAEEMLKECGELTLLSASNSILELAEDSELSEEFFKAADKFITYLSNRQSISAMQAVMLTLFLETSALDNRINVSDVAGYLRCRNLKVLQYQEEIDGLVEKGLLLRHQRSMDNSVSYVVPRAVMSAFKKNQPYQRMSYAGCVGNKLFQHFLDIMELRRDDMLSTQLAMEEVDRLFADNPDLHFVKVLKSLGLYAHDELVITHLASLLVIDHRDGVSVSDMKFLFDRKYDRNEFVSSMEDGSHLLILGNLLEYAFCDGFKSNRAVRLADDLRVDLLRDYDVRVADKDIPLDVVANSTIASKELYFETKVQRQLDVVADLMSEEHYQSICARLREKGLRQGFTCLFYGAPGTGKTESVFQLARMSGRDIMQVNISEVKSKWVGDSEKNIKGVFDRYRIVARHSQKVPILLFNEADAIIGKRKEGAERSVDRMENSIQNIILQEMESFNGIMIATTNLVQNLDAAFERRFLYKVKFERPALEQRRQIWHSMMPMLTEDTAERLASHYDFSGGQIENIARKCDIDSILYGDDAMSVERMERYCMEETIELKSAKKMGFL